jgi:PAS domain S-box-containing protein
VSLSVAPPAEPPPAETSLPGAPPSPRQPAISHGSNERARGNRLQIVLLLLACSALIAFVTISGLASKHQQEKLAREAFENEIQHYEKGVHERLMRAASATRTVAAGVATNPQTSATGLTAGGLDRQGFAELSAAALGDAPLGAVGAVALVERVGASEFDQWQQHVRREYFGYRIADGRIAAAASFAGGDRLLLRHRWPVWMISDGIGKDSTDHPQRATTLRAASLGPAVALSGGFIDELPAGPALVLTLVAQVPPPASAVDTQPRQWISTLLIASELFSSRPTGPKPLLAVGIRDTAPGIAAARELYDSHAERGTSAPAMTAVRTMEAFGRVWHITYSTTPAFEAAYANRAWVALAITGALVALMAVFGLAWFYFSARNAATRSAQSEARFERLNRTLPIGVIEADAHGRCTYVNATLVTLCARPAVELLGRGLLRAVHPADRGALLARWRQARGEGRPLQIEHRVRLTNGAERWMRTTLAPQHDAAGVLTGHVGNVADVTAERAHTAEFERLAMIARETTDGIQIIDPQGRSIWVNRAFEDLTGYSLDEVVGKRGREYLAGPDTDPGALAWIEASLRAKEPHEAEILNYRKGGEPRWWHLRAQPLFDAHGTHIGFFQIRSDITERKVAEAAAQAALLDQQRAEARLLQAIESLDAAFALFDGDERLVVCNERHRQLAGLLHGELRPGMLKHDALAAVFDGSVAAHTPAADRERAREAWIDARLAEFRGTADALEQPIGAAWFRTTHRRTPLGDTVALRTEITEQRAREAQFRKLSLVASHSANAVVITDSANRVDWVNEGFERSTGFRLHEIRGKQPAQFLHGPNPDPDALAQRDRLLEHGTGHQFDCLNYRRSGEPFWVSVDRQPILDAEGRIEFWFSVVLDITERKRAELALRASEARNRTLALAVQQAGDAIITKDLDNRIASWNRGAEILYGFSAGEAVGRRVDEFIYGVPDPERAARALARVRAAATETRTLEHRRADGEWIKVEASYAPQYDDAGALVGQVMVVRDITARLRVQSAIEDARLAAEQARRAMSTFLANMSHELRTPMHAILSYTRLSRERLQRAEPDRVMQHLQRIEDSGERLLRLLNELLDLSRLEADGVAIEPGANDLAAAIGRSIDEVAAYAQSAELRLRGPGERTFVAWFDPARVAQVLTNLLGNAIKFSPAGSVVDVLLDRLDPAEGPALARVTVADRGIGIPEAERERVFDKFEQSSRTRTGAGGTGLGLAISRELITRQGGTIWVEPNPGGGTRLVFTLPIGAPGAAAAERAGRQAA